MKNIFRPLKPNEVIVRPVEVGSSKVTLLLYQDARCAQNILDETVGQYDWQREYYESNNMLFCKIGIRNRETNEWIWKSDTGSESNFESEKGLASDAFKRAAVSWGIGRELYTAPRISIERVEKDNYKGEFCQSFSVSYMKVEEGVITALRICDKWGNERFTYSSKENPQISKTNTEINSVPKPQWKTNTDILSDFVETMKHSEDTNVIELERFQEYFLKPSRENPSSTIIECWSNPKPEKMWQNWLKNSRAT